MANRERMRLEKESLVLRDSLAGWTSHREDVKDGRPEAEIRLEPGSRPPFHRAYKFSFGQLEELRVQLDKLTELGFIRPSKSPYGAPVMLVPKPPDGSGVDKWRMVIDYRGINAITVRNRSPLPIVS